MYAQLIQLYEFLNDWWQEEHCSIVRHYAARILRAWGHIDLAPLQNPSQTQFGVILDP